ncbi:MAG: TraB/GumN family protein [Bacteroidetes bacterium]|nr:TraB/GumN family protein [Bacteroidota bacterium]
MGYRLFSIFCVIGFLITNLAAYGQEDLIRTTFWKIIKPGAKDTSYLLGTNSICTDTYVLKNTIILRKLETCKYYLTENNFFLSSIADYRVDPDSIRWHHYATRSEKKRIRDFFHCEKCYRNPDVIHMNIYYLKSWLELIGGALNSNRVSKKEGAYYMEYDLQMRVKNRRRIVALESKRQNHAYYMLSATMGVPQTKEVVKRNIHELDSMIGVFKNDKFRIFPNNRDSLIEKNREVVDNYYNNFIYYNFSGKSFHLFDSILLEKRSKDWLPKIFQHINKSKCFISVDLENLKYKYGLIQLLKAEGYIVEPILLEELKK